MKIEVLQAFIERKEEKIKSEPLDYSDYSNGLEDGQKLILNELKQLIGVFK